jgi:N-acetylmuramoyl-L-alanine amidase
VFVPIRLRDEDLALGVRDSMAKQLSCDLVIEIHHNSLPTVVEHKNIVIVQYR